MEVNVRNNKRNDFLYHRKDFRYDSEQIRSKERSVDYSRLERVRRVRIKMIRKAIAVTTIPIKNLHNGMKEFTTEPSRCRKERERSERKERREINQERKGEGTETKKNQPGRRNRKQPLEIINKHTSMTKWRQKMTP